MTEIQRWEFINQAETSKALAIAIRDIMDEDGMIQGRTRKFDGEKMIIGLDMFMKDEAPANVITREYGLRQQAIYLKHF